MQISIIGGGYVGLVSAACLASLKHDVDLIEIDQTKVDIIRDGKSPIYENGLEELLQLYINKNLNILTNYSNIINSDIIIICVGTPQDIDGKADLSIICSAAHSIGRVLSENINSNYPIIAVKSTVPPGTTENLVKSIILQYIGKDASIGFIMNPEFLREGSAVSDFMQPDRIVIGSSSNEVGDKFEEIYKKLNAKVVRVSITAAEMIKYTSNAFLATKISFANEIGNICKQLNINVYDVMLGVGFDHRINPHFLNAGLGFGGSCFPKDVSALIYLANSINSPSILLESVMEVNRQQPDKLIKLLLSKFDNIENKKIAILGLAFKNNTDDVRESRAIPIISELLKMGANIIAYDPQANKMMQQIFPTITYCDNAVTALTNADACLVLTEWQEFKELSAIEFNLMKSQIIIDGRNILSYKGAEGICW